MPDIVKAAVIQFPVTMEPECNVEHLAAAAARLEPGTIAVAPEGALSGYLPQRGFVTALNSDATVRAIAAARKIAAGRRLHLIAGACIHTDGLWRNSSFYMGPAGELERYDKINLAQSERGTFEPGSRLPVYDIAGGGAKLRLGIQMCREIRYPEQWRVLAEKGAQVIAYVNNAVSGMQGADVWRAHMISRAAETQRFVLGANNADAGQICPSMIVAPSGKVLAEIAIGAADTAQAALDMDEVSDWVLGQARRDVVEVRAKG